MPDTCPHGFSPSTCLICSTLAGRPGPSSAEQPGSRVQVADAPRRNEHHGRERVAPDAVLSGGDIRSGRSLGRRVATTGIAVVVLALAAWLVVGLAFAVLHLIELVFVAGAAGYLGYRIGVVRGRHRA